MLMQHVIHYTNIIMICIADQLHSTYHGSSPMWILTLSSCKYMAQSKSIDTYISSINNYIMYCILPLDIGTTSSHDLLSSVAWRMVITLIESSIGARSLWG